MPWRSHVYYEMHSRFKDVKRVRVPTPGLSSCHSQGCGYRSEKLQIKISTGEGAGHKVQESQAQASCVLSSEPAGPRLILPAALGPRACRSLNREATQAPVPKDSAGILLGWVLGV